MTPDTESLRSHLDFMRGKLEESRIVLENLPIAYTRTSTQGEQVLKRNAAFTAYEELLAAYCRTLREYREAVKDAPPEQTGLLKFEQFAKSMRKHA